MSAWLTPTLGPLLVEFSLARGEGDFTERCSSGFYSIVSLSQRCAASSGASVRSQPFSWRSLDNGVQRLCRRGLTRHLAVVTVLLTARHTLRSRPSYLGLRKSISLAVEEGGGAFDNRCILRFYPPRGGHMNHHCLRKTNYPGVVACLARVVPLVVWLQFIKDQRRRELCHVQYRDAVR